MPPCFARMDSRLALRPLQASLSDRKNQVYNSAEARNVVQSLLNRARRSENRKNENKTTVWFDDETREWLETRAYLTDSSVWEIIRRIVAEAKKAASEVEAPGRREARQGTSLLVTPPV